MTNTENRTGDAVELKTEGGRLECHDSEHTQGDTAMTTEEFGLREGDRADNAAVREIMDAMQQAAMRHPAFNPDNMERYMAIALAASATLSGAIFGQMIALGMVDDTTKQKRIGREGVARNFNLGIPMGMDITARAMRGVGAYQ